MRETGKMMMRFPVNLILEENSALYIKEFMTWQVPYYYCFTKLRLLPELFFSIAKMLASAIQVHVCEV